MTSQQRVQLAREALDMVGLYRMDKLEELIERCSEDVLSYVPPSFDAKPAPEMLVRGREAYLTQLRAIRARSGAVTPLSVSTVADNRVLVEVRDENGNEGKYLLTFSPDAAVTQVYCLRSGLMNCRATADGLQAISEHLQAS